MESELNFWTGAVSTEKKQSFEQSQVFNLLIYQCICCLKGLVYREHARLILFEIRF